MSPQKDFAWNSTVWGARQLVSEGSLDGHALGRDAQTPGDSAGGHSVTRSTPKVVSDSKKHHLGAPEQLFIKKMTSGIAGCVSHAGLGAATLHSADQDLDAAPLWEKFSSDCIEATDVPVLLLQSDLINNCCQKLALGVSVSSRTPGLAARSASRDGCWPVT